MISAQMEGKLRVVEIPRHPSYQFFEESSFVLVAGVSGKSVSFRSVKYPQNYIRTSKDLKLVLNADNGEDSSFEEDVSFIPRMGLMMINEPTAKPSLSFESVSHVGKFIRQHKRKLWYSDSGGHVFNRDSSWIIEGNV